MSENLPRSFTFGVVTMSDKGARGEREDTSGPYIKEKLSLQGYLPVSYRVIPDNLSTIVDVVSKLADEDKVALIVTTGGTGVSPTDVTPEAMTEIFEKEVPGIAELMRLESLKITPRAALSRGRAGIRKQTLIINLPGSLKAVKENLDAVLPLLEHALEKIAGDESDCGVIQSNIP